MLVDRYFEVSTGLRSADVYHGIKIPNLQHVLVVKCRTMRDCDEWSQHLSNLVEQAKGFVNVTASRFDSFASVQKKISLLMR